MTDDARRRPLTDARKALRAALFAFGLVRMLHSVPDTIERGCHG
jgi:hypothetical protein